MRHVLLFAALLILLSACGDAPLKDPSFSRTDAVTSVCAGGATVKGIDVSTWQGTINWSAVAGSGLSFAIARISDGDGYYDTSFDQNWPGMKSAGLIRGAYQFFEPGQDAATQANLVVRVVGQLGPGNLPVTLDVETATPTAEEIQTWVNAVQAGTGKTPMIYAGWGLWNQWLPNGGFGSLPLWVANYGVNCPGLPAGWGGWQFWQYADNTSVPGISGNVDGDVFNGSLEQLQQFAGSDQAPRGYFDSADCSTVAGWSQDLDVPTQSINVDVYFGGAAGSGAPGQRLDADNARSDLCTALGSCNHGFSSDTPRGLMDGAAHDIHAYGIDANGSANVELTDSPKSVTCTQSETGVRRHIGSPAVLTAWGFDVFQDVRPITDAVFNGYAEDSSWPDTRVLLRGDSTPSVWVVDGVFKRHLVSPTSAAEWHIDLSTVTVVPEAQVDAMPTGPDLRERPTLIKGSGAAIDQLDDPLPALPAPDAGSSETTGTTGELTTGSTASTGSTGESSTGTSGTSASENTTTTSSTTSTTGNSTTSSGTSGTTGGIATGGCTSSGGDPAWLALIAVGVTVARRRRLTR